MNLLYYDQWSPAPAPAPFPGCVTVDVTHACTPGRQGSLRVRLSPPALMLNRLRNARRLATGTMRHLKRYGVHRTLAVIGRSSGSLHLRGRTPVASFAGRISGSEQRVAGYRFACPAFADQLTAHPDQLADLPAGLAPDDAATVLYYTFALCAFQRLAADSPRDPIVICGATLTCRLLERRLADEQLASRVVASPEAINDEDRRLLEAGAPLVIGDSGFRPSLEPWVQRALFTGISADELTSDQFAELEPRWIGLPHSSLSNLDLYSMMPLEVGESFKSVGLEQALRDMAARRWRPRELLTPVRVDAGAAVDLSAPCLITAAEPIRPDRQVTLRRSERTSDGRLRVAAIGLGNWSTDTLLPILAKNARVQLRMGIDRDPMRLQMAERLFRFDVIASDAAVAFESPDIDAVFIATQHDSHAEYALRALEAGKKVFVEKPPLLNYEELDCVVEALRRTPRPFLAVGYNRAHWVWTDVLRAEIEKAGGPANISALVRELEIARTHPYNWPQLGPRVSSNGCHWIDLAHRLLGGREPRTVQVVLSDAGPQANNIVIVRYGDGSLVSLTFSDRGDVRAHVHEYIDIKARGLHCMIDDFKRLTRYEDGWIRQLWAGHAERGWEREVQLAVDGMLGGPLPRRYDDVLTSAMLVLEARLSFERSGEVRTLDADRLRAYREMFG